MQSKSLLIAIAAFAVTTTGVSAYGNASILNRAGLSDQQRSAIEAARELRQEGDLEGARNVLVEAGIDEDALMSIRDARKAAMAEMHQALEEGDYVAFQKAITDSPLADLITTEEDFEQFREAHSLRQNGEFDEARDIFSDLGIEHRGRHHQHHRGIHVLAELSEEQREAFLVAKRANDRDTMQAILDEAGVSFPPKGGQR